ncbi:Toprim domain-containing protein [Clostridium sp. USBA 49]|nr:Toprim domain-containing protein [Clostridium sp. USBA 49]
MRIFKDQIETYNKIINKYNTIFNGDKLDFNSIVNSAVAELLQSDFDFKNLKNYNYYTKGSNSWAYKYVKLNYDLWKQIAEKLDFKNLPKNIQEDKIDNVVNTALSKATDLKWRLRKEVIDAWDKEDDKDIIDWKKAIIDNNGWTIDKLMRVLKAIGAVQNLNDYHDKSVGKIYQTKCPLCDKEDCRNTRHVDWIIDNGSIPYYNCIKCEEKGTIIKLLNELHYVKLLNGIDAVSFIYSVLYSHGKVDLTKNVRNDVEVKKAREERQKEEELKREKAGWLAEQILEECTKDNWYLFRKKFKKEDLGFDVYYRDFNMSELQDKDAKYWSNVFRGCCIYAIKDDRGNIIGLKGRRTGKFIAKGKIRDKEEDILEIVKEDEWFSKQKNELVKKLKINLKDTKTDDTLYLLYKYVENPWEIDKLVIVEGEKDALRIASQNIKGVAVVASFGCALKDKQVELIKKYFNSTLLKKDIEIVLVYDNDVEGAKGNIRAYKKLKKAGFTNIVFGNYVNDKYKDAGDMYWRDMHTAKMQLIIPLVYTNLTIKDYVKRCKERGFDIDEEIKGLDELKEARIEIKNNEAKDFWTAQAEEWKKENDTISNAEQLVEQPEEITFDINAERTADWFATLIKLAEKEAGSFVIDIDAEVASLQENGKEEWFKEFMRRYGELPYNILLIVAKVEAKIKAREMLLARFRKQAVVDDAANDNYIPF